ncbi:hypothetical protein NPIL_420471 [Nephila pilipes]|uniref:Uncharacterized protein n=1 Tax=Nephila pilipes TaxID=299642 RepID=A0A8X6KLW1_NEPPI|nr:hypothetical protein NPIL_420471 [Nephila pilipes]
MKIDGVKKIVESDDNLLARRKNVELVPPPQLENIAAGSLYFLDYRKAYKTEELINANYEQFTINSHINTTDDPDNGYHIQMVTHL